MVGLASGFGDSALEELLSEVGGKLDRPLEVGEPASAVIRVGKRTEMESVKKARAYPGVRWVTLSFVRPVVY